MKKFVRHQPTSPVDSSFVTGLPNGRTLTILPAGREVGALTVVVVVVINETADETGSLGQPREKS